MSLSWSIMEWRTQVPTAGGGDARGEMSISCWHTRCCCVQLQTTQTMHTHDTQLFHEPTLLILHPMTQVDTKTVLITLIQPKITYCLLTFRLHVRSLHQDWLALVDRESDKAGRLIREAIWIRKTDNTNRDEGSYQLSHVWDKLLHTDNRHRKSVLMKASDMKLKRR